MIHAELTHNPYLLQTSVKFNGQLPRINSQVEKYDTMYLKEWIERVPQIFYDEMNGYDFDLYFTGTKSDFDSLCDVFFRAGISQKMVRLFHKNEIEDAESKKRAVDSLIQWLRNNPNRKFDFNAFYSEHRDLFEGSYPYIVVNGHTFDSIHPQVSVEIIHSTNELRNTNLTDTPVLFFIDPQTTKSFREDLLRIITRTDVLQNQLFFMIHPQLDAAQIARVITDLGVNKPQIVSSFCSEEILKYLQNYPITDYIRKVIDVFNTATKSLTESLAIENKESEQQNAEVYASLDEIENQILKLKETDLRFTERDNYSVGNTFSELSEMLRKQIISWRNRKTKVVGDSECALAAAEYDADIKKYIASFISTIRDLYKKLSTDIYRMFKTQYIAQGLDIYFSPADLSLPAISDCWNSSLVNEFMSLMEVSYEDQKYDLMALFGLSGSKEEKPQVRVATCYYAKWREKALECITPYIENYLSNVFQQLCNYYNSVAEAFHEHLTELITSQEAKKDQVAAQLSEDERKLQEDNDWLAEFKEQLVYIERG